MKNFEIEIHVDGHWRRIKIGPKAADGGFTIRIRQLDGHKHHPTPMEITGYARNDGDLTLTMAHGPTYFKKITKR